MNEQTMLDILAEKVRELADDRKVEHTALMVEISVFLCENAQDKRPRIREALEKQLQLLIKRSLAGGSCLAESSEMMLKIVRFFHSGWQNHID